MTKQLFTEKDLVSFGNSLFSHHGVNNVNPSTGEPISIRRVTDADIDYWNTMYVKDSTTEAQQQQIVKSILEDWGKPEKTETLPSAHQIGELVRVFIMLQGEETGPGMPARILGVHFYPGKVKYDVELLFVGDYSSRIYNVDSVLVLKPTN